MHIGDQATKYTRVLTWFWFKEVNFTTT